jgi:invasion protein IalB
MAASGIACAQTAPRAAPVQQSQQVTPAPQVTPAQPATPAQQAAPAQPAAPPPPQPFRTEILNFDNWSVTCREFAEGKRKRICVAALQIVQQNTNQVVFTWTIVYDDDNRPVTTFQTPSGVMIAPGLELKTAKATRSVPFVSCEPGRCTASVVMDVALARELAGSPDVEASIHASGGNTVRFDIPMKGYDKAFAALK